jgi:CRP/FNR family transcriptional regulator, cyclic AMP receptor protein
LDCFGSGRRLVNAYALSVVWCPNRISASREPHPMSNPHESLRKIGLFQSLNASEIEMLERRCRWRHAHAKEWLYEVDEQGTDVYFLTRGTVRVLITPSPDRAVILTDINAGGYFGELAAIDGQPRSAGILALTDATIACMSASVFLEIFHKYPDIREQVLRLLVARIRTLTQRVNEFSSMHVKHRIYAELLRRSRADSTDPRRAIVSPPPVHSDIAARVSTRREMVTRELKALERAGLLTKRRGALVITSVPELIQQIQSASH